MSIVANAASPSTTATSQPRTTSSRRPPPPVLKAEIADVRALASLLRPISFAVVANCSISEAGLQFTTEADRSVQAVAYVSWSIFDVFEIHVPTSSLHERGGDVDGENGSPDGYTSQLDPDTPSLGFDISLSVLLECINVFGGAPSSSNNSFTGRREGLATTGGGGGGGVHPEDRFARDEAKATKLNMLWRGVGSPLILVLEEQQNSSVTSRCEIATYEPAFALGLEFSHQDMQAQAILPSAYLLDAFQSIDQASCSTVSLLFSNNYSKSRSKASETRTYSSTTISQQSEAQESLAGGTGTRAMFRIQADGDFGTSETEFPDEASVLELFSCACETRFSYRFSHFARLLKALQCSLRASMRVSDLGLLSVQLMMPKGTGNADVGTVGGHGNSKKRARNDATAIPTGTTAAAEGHGFLEFLIAPLDEELDGDVDRREEDEAGGRNQRNETSSPPLEEDE